MSISSFREKRDLIQWARRVSQLASERDPHAAEAIDRAIENLDQYRFVLTVVGKAKRGKSTLINALLSRNDDAVAPIDKLPASSAVSRFRRDDFESATVVRRDGGRQTISFAEIRQYVTEEGNPNNSKEVAVVEIGGPFAGLDPDLELVDTPGAGSLHAHHDELLHGFLPLSDAVIFLVTARMPLDQEELALLGRVTAADVDKIFFAVNRVDEISPQDVDDAERHNRTLLAQAGVSVEAMHRISAKRAFQGDLAESGVPELCRSIQRYLDQGKHQAISKRFVGTVMSIVQPALEGLQVEATSRSKSAAELTAELATLADKKRSIETERPLAEREFQRDWKAAVLHFEDSLGQAKERLRAQVDQIVGAAGLTEVNALARQLPTKLSRLIDDALEPVSREFESAARDACEKLQASYPSVAVGEAGAISIRTNSDAGVVATTIGGGAVAAAGAGLALVGGATAASIAAANAAALAATTTIAAPSLVSSLLVSTGLEFLAPLATGTATVAAPAALTTTPLWVALAGPVGWTLAGVGLLTVPFSWRLSKTKQREKLLEAAQEQVQQVFKRLQSERLPKLREMGSLILEEFRVRLDRQLAQIENALTRARDVPADPAAVKRIAALAEELTAAISVPMLTFEPGPAAP